MAKSILFGADKKRSDTLGNKMEASDVSASAHLTLSKNEFTMG